MDTDDGEKETFENLNLSLMRSDSGKRSDNVGESSGLISVSGGEKSDIDKEEKSTVEGTKKRKLSETTEHDTSPKSVTGQSGTSKMNSNDGEKVEIDIGKCKKRKLSSMEETTSKPNESTNRLDETRTEENLELPIFKLPGELLIKIIDLVPLSQWASLESVSRRFQEVVHGLWGQLREIRLDELFYNEEKKRDEPYRVGDTILKKFLIRAPNVTSISGFDEIFDGGRPINLPTIRLLSKFEHLQTIDFSGESNVITARNLAAFLESSSSRECWKSLNVAGGIVWEDGVYGSMKNKEFGSKKNQPILNLECFKFNSYTVWNFDRFLPIEWSRLKKLVIVIDSLSYRHRLIPKCAKQVISIIRQCTQLVHLELELPRFENQNDQPLYHNFMQAVVDLENLSVLKIIGQWWLDRAFHDALLVRIPDLGRRGIIELALEKVYCTDEILDAIIDYLPRLKSLEIDVKDCTKASLEHLVNTMGQLETLKIRSEWDSKIDGTIIRAIAGNMIGLQCLHLQIAVCNSKSFTSLCELGNLKELRLSGLSFDCGNIETLARLGFGTCLEALELSVKDNISPDTMGDLLKNMPRLICLRLHGATDDILQAVAKSCPRLVELELLGHTSVTATGIQAIIDRCSQLKLVTSRWIPKGLTVGKYRKITFDTVR